MQVCSPGIATTFALEDTGIDNEGNLQACWPFTDSSMNHCISSTSNKSHNWFRVIKDTRDASTFAVVSQRCLEFREHGIVRSCLNSCKNELSRPQQTVLCTRILLNSSFEPDAVHNRLRIPQMVDRNIVTLQNTRFLVGEAYLIMKKAMQKDPTFVIIAVNANPWQRRFWAVLAERSIPCLQEQIHFDITTGVSGLLFVY